MRRQFFKRRHDASVVPSLRCQLEPDHLTGRLRGTCRRAQRPERITINQAVDFINLCYNMSQFTALPHRTLRCAASPGTC